MIVNCMVTRTKIDRVYFLPVLINQGAQPVVVTEEAEIEQSLDNMIDPSLSQNLDTKFEVERGETVVRC